MMRTLAMAALLMLGGCQLFSPKTTVHLVFDDGAGKKIEADYTSTKDVAAPAFRLERDPEGRIQQITIGADSASASPVVDANAGLVAATTAGIVGGLAKAGMLAVK